MKKAKKVIDFYMLTNVLKNVIRTGWLNWRVKADRVESVAEHIYGVQMLALAMYSEYQYDIDMKKVMYMLAVHELEETVIGDLTYLDISAEDKKSLGHTEVEKILANLINGEEIKELIWEFDERQTKEAIFAYHCDKLECDLQCKIYDEAGYVDPFEQEENEERSPEVIEKLKNGETTWSECWLQNDKSKYEDDDNFMEVLKYTLENKISFDDGVNK